VNEKSCEEPGERKKGTAAGGSVRKSRIQSAREHRLAAGQAGEGHQNERERGGPPSKEHSNKWIGTYGKKQTGGLSEDTVEKG